MRAAPALAYSLSLVILILAGSVDRAPAQDLQTPGFSLYAHAFLDPDRKPTVLVGVTIPYTSLIFLKKGPRFESEYTAYIKMLDKKKELVDTAVLNESVTADDYESTRSAKTSAKTSRRFQVSPGEYIVKCVIEVKSTLRVFEKDVPVTVPEFPETGIGVGKPRLFSAELDTSRILPMLIERGGYPALSEEEQGNAVFSALDSHPVIEFELYSQEEARDSFGCDLYYEVVDGKKVVRAYGRREVKISGLRGDFIVYLDVDEWDPGPYVFLTKAVQRNPDRETISNLDFTIGYTRAMLTKNFEKTIEILSLVATKQETDELKNAPIEERGRLWTEFWARRDPSPGTAENEALDEHLRRVRHATENFSDGGAGWQSDRGKVYIKYGEPDHTEVRTDPQYQGQYLVWNYYQRNLTFVFYDRFGLGEFRLTDSSQL